MAASRPDGGRHLLGDGLAAKLQSRPLKTGKSFALVVHAPRVHHLGWDRADYAPGDPCQLTLKGARLGTEPLELVVEAEREGGGWAEVDKVKATVDSGQSAATVRWTFPVPPGHEEALAAREQAKRGALLSATWARAEVPEGAPLSAVIEAKGMDGQDLVVLFEREFPDGSWRGASHAGGAVKGGRCEVAWTPPSEASARPGDPGAASGPQSELVACKFEDGLDLGAADTAWLKANVAGLEGQTVQFVLERDEGGAWGEVSSAVSTVKAGEVHAGILLDGGREQRSPTDHSR